MGTFHNHESELHGITVLVETTDNRLLIGRCHDENDREVILLDADIHGPDHDLPREEYIERAIKFGVWAKHPRLVLPRSEVTEIRRLGEMV